jgi:hypothetical protein
MTYPVPYLTFLDFAGTDAKVFNTFRLGKAWFSKLGVGDRVLIGDKRYIEGERFVRDLWCGPAKQMLVEHATLGHVEIHLRGQLGKNYDTHTAWSRRLESLRKIYGPQRVLDTTALTVICLETR